MEQELTITCSILKQAASESLGTKRKWYRKRNLKILNEEIANIIKGKQQSFQKYI